MSIQVRLKQFQQEFFATIRLIFARWRNRPNGRTLLLRQAGAFRDDESLADLRRAIYQARNRPEVETSTFEPTISESSF